MDQKPVPGQEALPHPSPDVAQQYLNEADAVAARRARAVDRRALAWLQIANAVITGGFLVAFPILLRESPGVTTQVLIFIFLVWGQLASGMAQRNGLQWRLTRERWPVLVGGGLLLVVMLVVFGCVALDVALPDSVILLPGVLAVLGFGSAGVVQLLRASRDPRHPRVAPVALPPGARGGTILLGAVVGALTFLSGVPNDVVRVILILLIALLLLAWIIASRSDFGLPAVGASWRWPHTLVFALSAGALVGGILLSALASSPGAALSALTGAGVAILFVAVSFVPGRAARA